MNDLVNREEWLHQGYKLLAVEVFKRVNIEVPADVKISCSFPSAKGLSAKRARIGECWAREASTAKVNEIFISPKVDNPVEVLDILAHELIHATDNCKSGHRGFFAKTAKLIGLEGKMTATHAGEVLKEKLQAIIDKIGEYPHARIDYTRTKKQSTRMIKVSCRECDFSYRTSQRNIDNIENHTCNCCGSWSMYTC